MYPFVKPQKEMGQHRAKMHTERHHEVLGAWVLVLLGSSVKPSPALDLYITVKTDRKTCKPLLSWPRPRQELRFAGWAVVWFTMYSRGWLQPGWGPGCRYLTRFSTEYTEM